MIDLVLHLTARGLPEPVREYPFAASIGRKWRFDFCYTDKKIGIEIDGGVYIGGRHSRGAGFVKDLEKLNYAARLGYRILRFIPSQVTSGEAADFIQKVLEAS